MDFHENLLHTLVSIPAVGIEIEVVGILTSEYLLAGSDVGAVAVLLLFERAIAGYFVGLRLLYYLLPDVDVIFYHICDFALYHFGLVGLDFILQAGMVDVHGVAVAFVFLGVLGEGDALKFGGHHLLDGGG
jgi:hypothetical protein